MPTPNSYPGGITAGPDGALWFVEDSPANNIGRLTTAGAITEYRVPTSNGLPYGITAGPDGALWFTESGGNKIGRITTTGAITEYSVPTANGYPLGITAGPDGELWFAEFIRSRIGQGLFLTATLSVSPARGVVGSKISFTGSGFAANEAVQIYQSGVGSAVLASATADSSGSITAAGRVPPSVSGPRLFVGVGQTSGKLGAASFSILGRLSLQPTSGPVGATVTAKVTGFGPLEPVTTTWLNPNTVLGTATADVNGNASLTFTVPSGAPSGANKVEVIGQETRPKAAGEVMDRYATRPA